MVITADLISLLTFTDSMNISFAAMRRPLNRLNQRPQTPPGQGFVAHRLFGERRFGKVPAMN
jgi:hypothetical protein